MIPYLEIKDKYTFKTVALVEPQEVWLELSFQDVGEFEIYCRASQANLKALQKGRYVTIPNKRFIWVITSVRYTFTAGGARMISAKGYEAKWLLNKRCILTPKDLSGTITSAVYGLVSVNMGEALKDDNPRKIKGFTVDTNNITDISVDGAQAPRGNLLEYVNNLLKAYGCGSQVIFKNGALKYTIFKGEDKTQSVRFSQSLDNLLASEYLTDDTNLATYALVVSTFDETTTVNGEEQKRKVDYLKEVDKKTTGIDRAEMIIASNLATKYEDANGEEKETTPDSTLYQGWQAAEGENALAERITTEEVNGEIDITNSSYTFDVDFFIGDTVRAQEEYFNYFINAKISKYRFKQDANGYGEEAEYGG